MMLVASRIGRRAGWETMGAASWARPTRLVATLSPGLAGAGEGGGGGGGGNRGRFKQMRGPHDVAAAIAVGGAVAAAALW